ncbi:MAG: transporter substrate-binding domain-containing protein [Myxococcota bacterium]
MRKFKLRSFVALLAVLALTAAACGGDDEPSDGGGNTGASTTGACATADTSAGDLLAKICEEGVIRVSTDPAYPPQSSLNPETNDYEGFDIDVATAIADKLGVEIEWETPKWEAITAGNWQDRWDMSVGSMTVTEERTQVLDFSPAYYYTPASVAVAEDSDIQSIDQLDGQTIGVCAGCTYDFYLQNKLQIPGYTFESPFTDITVKGYDTDSTAIQALVSGQVQGAMSATPTLEKAIEKGQPIRIVGDPLFYEPLSVAFDKESELDQASLVAAVSDIIDTMHSDGSLTDLSMQWYGTDLTTSNESTSS